MQGRITESGSTNAEFVILILFLLAFPFGLAAQTGAARINGTVLDPAGRTVAGARVEFDSASGARLTTATGADGGFTIALPAWGAYTARGRAQG